MFYQLGVLNCRINGCYIFKTSVNQNFRYIFSSSIFNYNHFKAKFLTNRLSINKNFKFSVNKSLSMSNGSVNSNFKLSDYDCIGFDLDNTLCQYNLKPLIQMEYISMMKYLCEERGYPSELLGKPLSDIDMHFLQRGLLLDLKKGNILKINHNGTILKACHGTKEMSEDDIVKTYGENKQWEVTNTFCQNMIATWNGPLSADLRSLLDYFDISASLVFARLVDHIDKVNGQQSQHYTAGADVLSSLIHIFKRDHFKTDKSNFFNEMKQNQSKYAHKCDPVLIEWLKKLKQSNKITFLLTGSYVDFASLTAQYCIGENWRDLFDIVVCFAKKPGFFFNSNPFIELNNDLETSEIKPEDLVRGGIYSQGNWKDLNRFLSKLSGKSMPRSVYFGDNIVQDIYTPSNFSGLDTVAVIEELSSETATPDPDSIFRNEKWGSYFKYKSTEDTIWGHALMKYSKICIPNMNYIAQLPLNTELQTFSDNKKESVGYHPEAPLSIWEP